VKIVPPGHRQVKKNSTTTFHVVTQTKTQYRSCYRLHPYMSAALFMRDASMTDSRRTLLSSSAETLKLWALLCILMIVPAYTANATPCSDAGLSVERISSPIFYFDPSLSPKLSSGYVGYKITNNTGSAIEDAWVVVDNFRGTVISLAPYENGASRVGRLAAGESTVVFFYLSATRQTSAAQAHEVLVYDGNPSRSSALCDQDFSLTTYDTISANPNKVFDVSISPQTPEVGGLLSITVRGNTGRVGSAGVFAFTPAALSSWRADVFELTSVRMTLSGGENRTVEDTLYLTGIKPEPSDYVQTYVFRVKGNPSTSTKIYPANYISSGNEVKHTDTSGYGGLPSIPSPENKVTLSGFSTSPLSPTCLTAAGEMSLSITITNAGSVPALLDDIQVVLPTSPETPVYVAGSSSYSGLSIGDPSLSGSILSWYSIFEVPANSSRTLTFDVSFSGVPGTYNFAAIGHIDDLQIDSTLTQSESAPATVSGCVGTPPTATPTPTIVPPAPTNDPDSDNDGISDTTEGETDPDGDGNPNDEDLDSDGDGITDIIEGGGEDEDKDGHPDSPIDTDNDGSPDEFDPDNGGTPLTPPDSDNDGDPDTTDRDSDGDGTPDVIESGGEDDDGNGILDPTEDNDDDGLDDSVDPDQGGDPLPIPDSDGDNTPDGRDGDSDNDGVPDQFETQPEDDYRPPTKADSDDDGVDDSFDPDSGGNPIIPSDTDGDSIPDYRDTDSDDDGLSDTNEGFDRNEDGSPDIVPSGSDGDKDGIDDSYEQIDTPNEIDPSQRTELWAERCSPQVLSGKLRSARSAIAALHRRVGSFAGKSKRCRGSAMIAEVPQAKTTYDLIMERLALEFGGDAYRCPSDLCVTSRTADGKGSIRRLINRLAAQAKNAKQNAIESCKTPAHPAGFVDSRMKTEDYRQQAAKAVGAFPATITRCP
jgi:hypothetical protein